MQFVIVVAGYNETLFRRRRLYPHINDASFHLRSYAERQAVNFCVQGIQHLLGWPTAAKKQT